MVNEKDRAGEGRLMVEQLASCNARGRSIVFCVFEDSPIVSASGLVIGTTLSRVGLRSLDLCTQLIVQEVRSFQHLSLLLSSSSSSSTTTTTTTILGLIVNPCLGYRS